MKKFLILLFIILCFTFPCFTNATGFESGEKTIKAEIYLKPEDMHPNGINMEIGTASFWFEVGARVSGDSGEKVSYQWYESKDGKMDTLEKVEGATSAVFIPEQKIGTTYYCAGVITTVGDKSYIEYTKLLEATFTPKMIDKIWIIGIEEPSIGKEIKNQAEQYTDYDLNDYYGYEISSVNWTPNDTIFKEGETYTVNVDVDYWDNVEFNTQLDVKINNKKANITEKNDGKGATVSYTFEKLEKVDDNKINSGEKSGDTINNQSHNTNQEENSLNISTVILVTIIVILLIFSIFIIIKKN